jgi:membrane-bound lytic murein transglycosylase B
MPDGRFGKCQSSLLYLFCTFCLTQLAPVGQAREPPENEASPPAAQSDEPKVVEVGFDLNRPEIAEFIHQVVSKDGFARDQIMATLAAAQVRPELAAAMDQPAETALPWWQYRQRFVTTARIDAGADYWQLHREEINDASAASGVAPEYLVAILGIETNYGQSTGTYREIDTLMTLAFDYPARTEFFRSELRQFLLLARDLGRDPTAFRGSYGGALGAPQMMPSNYRRFAAGRAKGKPVDLWTDSKAILKSVADFLRRHGWVKGGPVIAEAQLQDGANVEIDIPHRFALNETLDSLTVKGIRVDSLMPGSTRAVLIQAALEDSLRYRVGFKNFYVIGRYNPRINYAMAVCDLARELRCKVVGCAGQE